MADAEFAADLAQVLRGNAPAQYADPTRFFSNTYPTRGLKDLLSNVCGRLSNGKGLPQSSAWTPPMAAVKRTA